MLIWERNFRAEYKINSAFTLLSSTNIVVRKISVSNFYDHAQILRKTDNDDGKHAHIVVIGYVYIVDDDCCCCFFFNTLGQQS